MLLQIYLTVHWPSGDRRPGFNPRWSHTKDFKKWYLMPPCLTLSIIRYGSSVKWSNPGKGVALFPTPWCSSYWKGNLPVSLDYRRQLYFYYKHIQWVVPTFLPYLRSYLFSVHKIRSPFIENFLLLHGVWPRAQKYTSSLLGGPVKKKSTVSSLPGEVICNILTNKREITSDATGVTAPTTSGGFGQ